MSLKKSVKEASYQCILKLVSKTPFFCTVLFYSILQKTTLKDGKIFLLLEFFRAFSKMKSAQWGFSFTKSNIHFLKQLCLYFNYITLTV
jgi:hypothetical protein